MIWIYVIGAVVLDGCAALVAALIPERWLERNRDPMLAFAAGVLLGTTFLDVLPEALRQLAPASMLETVLGSLVVMVLLEWTLGARGAGESHGGLATILLGADSFHNAADGGAIAAAFMASTRLGIITAAAVIIHEVPEEVAVYGVLRKAGLARGRAILAMTAVQLTAAVGALVALLGATMWRPLSGAVLAVAGGTFLHIAEVDLVPTVLARGGPRARRAKILAGFVLGVGFAIAESVM